MVGETCVVAEADKSAFGLVAKVLGIVLKYPFGGENSGLGIAAERCRDIKLVKARPYALVFVGSFSFFLAVNHHIMHIL